MGISHYFSENPTLPKAALTACTAFFGNNLKLKFSVITVGLCTTPGRPSTRCLTKSLLNHLVAWTFGLCIVKIEVS